MNLNTPNLYNDADDFEVVGDVPPGGDQLRLAQLIAEQSFALRPGTIIISDALQQEADGGAQQA